MRYNNIKDIDFMMPSLEDIYVDGNNDLRFKYLDFIFYDKEWSIAPSICNGDYLEILDNSKHWDEFRLDKLWELVISGHTYIDCNSLPTLEESI
jgi:hypothetical protein